MMPRNFAPLPIQHRPRSAARGVSLIEMLAVMSASAVIVAAAVAMLVTIGRADRGVDNRVGQQHALARLAAQLRSDLHAATAAAWDESQSTLRLTNLDGRVITYVAGEEMWVRRQQLAAENTENQTDGELAGAFPMPAGVNTSVEPAQTAAGQLVRLNWTIPAAATSRDAPPTSVELAALVGHDERLLHE